MNREQRRQLGIRKPMPKTLAHQCSKANLVRCTGLDGEISASPCERCSGTGRVTTPEMEWVDCPECTNGMISATIFMGYQCPVCTVKHVQMSWNHKGHVLSDWKTERELREGR